MPSEEEFPVEAARAVLRPRADAFRSAVAATREEVRGWIEAHRKPHNGSSTRAHHGLGSFAAGRIDLNRFASLVSRTDAVDAATLERIEAALATLDEVHACGDDLFRVEVPAGGSLRDALEDSLARAGRAFGAARVVELCKSGRYHEAEHASWLAALPFAQWHAAERRSAPPMIVTLEGDDLLPGGVQDYLDGAVRIVFLVKKGPGSPAPLARLITPGTLVAQVDDPQALEILASAPGPAVAAVMPAGAARFVHMPGGGPSEPGRLTVDDLPGDETLRPRARRSVAQQREDLRMLRLLQSSAGGTATSGSPGAAREAPGSPGVSPRAGGGSSSPADPGTPGAAPAAPTPAPAAPADPAEKLAAWLLSIADLSGSE